MGFYNLNKTIYPDIFPVISDKFVKSDLILYRVLLKAKWFIARQALL